MRQLTHAVMVANGMAPTLVARVYSKTSLLPRAVHALEDAGIQIGTVGTMGRDLPRVFELLNERLALRLRGTMGSISTDAATFSSDKVVAILYESSAYGKPVLLSLCVPSGEGVYDHAACAVDVIAALTKFRLTLTGNCVSLVGDNVDFNTALARLLGLARAKCVPHALNLTAKHGMALIPQLKALCQDAGAIIKAGGTNKRVAELQSPDFDLAPSKMIVYPDRFASLVAVANYRRENFAAVRRWHMTGLTVPAPAAEGEEDDDDDEEEEDGVPKAVLLLKRADRARKAYEDQWAPLHLHLCDILWGELTDLISCASATFDNVPSDLLERLDLFYNKLKRIAQANANGTPGPGARQTVDQATADGYPGMTIVKKGEAVNKFAAPVMNAAKASMLSYEKHIVPAAALLERRFRFDVRRGPGPRNDTGVYSNTKDFYGCFPEQYGVQMDVEWTSYVNEWWSKSARDPEGDEEDHPKFYWAKMRNYEYWKSKTLWNKLRPVALYWIEVPTSSISVERTFGLGRIIDVPQRRSMTWEAFRHELSFRLHHEELDKMLEEELNKLKK